MTGKKTTLVILTPEIVISVPSDLRLCCSRGCSVRASPMMPNIVISKI